MSPATEERSTRTRKSLLVGTGAFEEAGGFGHAGTVGVAVEDVPADGDAGHPVGTAAGGEALGVGFEGGAGVDLGAE